MLFQSRRLLKIFLANAQQNTFFTSTEITLKRLIGTRCLLKDSFASSPLLVVREPVVISSAGMKYHVGIHLRCEDCRFTHVDNRRAVLCKTHPRHNQIQKGKGASRRIHKTYPWRWPDPFDKKYALCTWTEDRYIKAFEK